MQLVVLPNCHWDAFNHVHGDGFGQDAFNFGMGNPRQAFNPQLCVLRIYAQDWIAIVSANSGHNV